MNNFCAGLLRSIVMSVNHFAYPLRLAGQVAVVCTGLDTGRNELGAVQRVRPDGSQYDFSSRRQGSQRFGIVAVRNDYFQPLCVLSKQLRTCSSLL